MQKHRLLVTALSLETFSAGELASAAGVPLNTARSELAREPDLFVPVGEVVRSGTPGRPPQRYRLRDGERARAMLTAAQRDASPAVVVEDEALSPADGQLLTLELAEHALRRALLGKDAESREDFARTAITTAGRTLESLAAMPDPELERRAAAIGGFAKYLRHDSQPDGPRDMSVVAASALTAFACIPSLGAAPLLTALLVLASQAGALPPIAVVTHRDTQPCQALSGLRKAGWRRRSFAGDLLWSPFWADALMDQRFLAGVVICDGGEDESELTRRIDEVGEWHLPTVVACPPESTTALSRVFAKGVTPLPTPDAGLALSWFGRRLTDHTRTVAAIDAGTDAPAEAALALAHS